MHTQSLLIIGSESASRSQLVENLKQGGWICHVANSIIGAQSIHGWQDVHVAFVSRGELLNPEFDAWTLIANTNLQLIGYDDSSFEQINEPSISSKLFAVVCVTQSPDWQVSLLATRASEYANSLASNASSLTESAYHKLLEASASLQSAESLPKLLEQTCREVSLGTGFGRSILVLGDHNYRIQTAQAYFADNKHAVNLSNLIGQPLLPVLPLAQFEQLGKGFAQIAKSGSNPADHLILPLERLDGAVIGFLTLDHPTSSSSNFSALSEPISLLLKLTVAQIETQQLRVELNKRNQNSEAFTLDRSNELRQAQERFSRFANLTDDIVYLTDANGTLIYLNEAFTTRLGYVRENYIGRTLESALTDLSAENAASESIINEIQSRDTNRTTYHLDFFTKTGYRTAFTLSHHWVRQGAEIVAGQGLLRDVTEQRELQTRLAHSERLGMAGKFASGLAHEINNPLQAISSHLASIGDRVDKDQKALESLGIVSDSVERIRLLAKSLLDLQRTELSSRTAVDINTIVEKALALLAPQLRSSEINVIRELSADLSTVNVNSGEIEQVLINLIVNAVEAMPSGGVLTIRSEEVAGKVRVIVKDTGRGITPKVMSTLFQPFSTHREQGGGLGMGLYISHNIVRQHGGELRAESQLGAGAEFSITLPIEK